MQLQQATFVSIAAALAPSTCESDNNLRKQARKSSAAARKIATSQHSQHATATAFVARSIRSIREAIAFVA